MAKYSDSGHQVSVQFFLDLRDAIDYMHLLRYGVPPWTASILITGQAMAGKEPSTPPHEKTYRERFGS